ncbi:hypothetical protein ACFXB4_00755 [Streptomyces lavendulae]|uniref:hypothetical protein n=1 Tax=Streptomyces lavendulae TaxID=1914 RepID=UPI0036B05A42
MESGIDPLGETGAAVADDLVLRFAEALARTPDTERTEADRSGGADHINPRV